MSSRMKFTAMELAALSVMAVVVVVSALALALNRCSSEPVVSQNISDSIVAAIDSARIADADSSSIRKIRKIKKSEKPKSTRQPRSRNYLDEPVEN